MSVHISVGAAINETIACSFLFLFQSVGRSDASRYYLLFLYLDK